MMPSLATALLLLLASTSLARQHEHQQVLTPVSSSSSSNVEHAFDAAPLADQQPRPAGGPGPVRVVDDDHPHLPRPRVAIIGGGAGGTSAAYFLRHLADHGDSSSSLACDVDLFEANAHLGGRSTTILPFQRETEGIYEDSEGKKLNSPAHKSLRYPPIELGASIFVSANKNLWKAVQVFNLTLQEGHGGGASSEEDRGMSIWNGESFVYRESSYSWWNLSKMIWRYGFSSPMNTRDTVKATVAKFVKLYGAEFQKRGPYRTIAAFAKGLELHPLAYKTAKEHLKDHGVGDLFIEELVGAATRVNYGQNPSSMQAFEGMVSMAASGASSVVGGNRQIYQNFARGSGAQIHLDTMVETITRLDDEEDPDTLSRNGQRSRQWLLKTRGTITGITTTRSYDAIIFSTPMHSPAPSTLPSINFINSHIPSKVPTLPYVHLYVTILVTNATNPRPEFFGVGETIPKSILSTFEPFESGKSKKRPRINSLNYLANLGELDVEHGVGEGHVVKLFSEYELSDDVLREAFGDNEVLWVYRKSWAAYPEAPVFTDDEAFPSFKPDNSSNFYYVSAFERWVSTMETETVSAWNAVSLLMKDLFGYHVQKSWAEWDDEAGQD